MEGTQSNSRGTVVVMHTETGWIVDEGVGPDPIGPFQSQEGHLGGAGFIAGARRVDVFGLRGEHIETIEFPEPGAV